MILVVFNPVLGLHKKVAAFEDAVSVVVDPLQIEILLPVDKLNILLTNSKYA